MTEFFDGHRLLINNELCQKCSVSNDNWGRQGVTPFALACYLYHAVYTLGKSPEEAFNALMTKWDSLFWGNSNISIVIWNKLFNGSALTEAEWTKIVFPLAYISTIRTSITTPTSKKECYPMFFGPSNISSDFFICTKEAYDKAIVKKDSAKVTAYRYGVATGTTDIIQGLREETTQVILPL